MKSALSLVTLTFTSLLAGCSSVKTETYKGIKYEIHRESIFNNVRELTKGNAFFHSRPIKDGTNYCMMEVGTPGSPYTGQPAFEIRLRDGSFIDPATIDVDYIRKHGHYSSKGIPVLTLYKRSVGCEERWPEKAELWFIYPWRFVIYKNQLQGISIIYESKYLKSSDAIPGVIKSGEDRVRTFPLSEMDIIDIFGAPDKVIEYLQE